MDRSSLNRVETTQDTEKRLAFKANLVNKINPQESKELSLDDNIFNGVSPGGILFHPSLGEGTLIEVDHGNNEVLIDFASKGLIGLVLNQAKSFVHAPIRQDTETSDDPFFGSEIQSRLLAPQDRDFREVDFSKVISPDFVDPEKSFFPVGSSVWHSDLGTCTVSSIDEKKNSLVLRTSSGAQIDMVLSQVRSNLRAIDTILEHVPIKPLIREPLAKQIPAYKSRGDVFVRIPEVFKSWQRNQQFLFLTRSQNLTTEQANDVFTVLEGDSPLFHTITITWQSQEEIEANVIPGPEPLSTKVDDARVFPNILENKNLWHPDFGECSLSSVDEKNNELILQTQVGLMPFVMDVTLSKLAVIAASAPEHAPKQLGVKAPISSFVKEKVQPRIILTLPDKFNSWKQVEQYQYLTGNKHLTPEDANAFLAGSADKFNVQWTNELPEANKRAEYKGQLLKRIEQASIEPIVPVIPDPVDPGSKRVVEEIAVVKKESVSKISVNLPMSFKDWTSSGQYVFLTRTRQLTFNEANDIMDILQNKPSTGTTQYEMIWDAIEPVAYGSIDSVRRNTEEIEIVEKEFILKKVAVILPNAFKDWNDSKQYSFLTRAKQLTINEANDVLNALQNKPFNSKTEYEIIWS